MSFSLDLAWVGYYNPATSRQAVSFLTSERITLSSFGTKRAPTSTNVAQTLSALTRQCQDDLGLSGEALEIGFGCMISVRRLRQAEVLCGGQALSIQR